MNEEIDLIENEKPYGIYRIIEFLKGFFLKNLVQNN